MFSRPKGTISGLAATVLLALAIPAAADESQAEPAPAAPHHCSRPKEPGLRMADEGIHAGFEGKTELTLAVSAEGKVSGIAVSKSSGDALFDNAAVECARNWTYIPLTKNGVAVAGVVHADFDWAGRLSGTSAAMPPYRPGNFPGHMGRTH
ncbi:MAG TPA: energy transducer TonB [Rhizomicrobium sp.]|nr:energy transducer TonB [Rhizomicrobium sp.]